MCLLCKNTTLASSLPVGLMSQVGLKKSLHLWQMVDKSPRKEDPKLGHLLGAFGSENVWTCLEWVVLPASRNKGPLNSPGLGSPPPLLVFVSKNDAVMDGSQFFEGSHSKRQLRTHF